MNPFKRSVIGAALLAAATLTGTAQAGTTTLDVSGISSNGAFGDASNEIRFIDLSSGVHITGLSWNVNLSTNGTSWLSEISVDLNDGALAGVSLFPGLGDDVSGAGSYSGTVDLVAAGLDFFLGEDGRLSLQFFEYIDDFVGADGQWDQGTLTVSYVPEPATFGLAALALLGVGATSRRRKS